jgi:RimJ/RimL family protein N-acetyltransferase
VPQVPWIAHHPSDVADPLTVPIPVVETDRLRLRGYREADIEALFAMADGDAVIAPFMQYNVAPLREACWRSVALWIGHWALRGFGMWAVEERTSGAFIGRIGLWQPEGWPGTEVGWMLGREWWGRGYATEAGRAAMDWGFEHLPVDELVSLIQPDNTASIAVAEKLGETFAGMVPYRGGETGKWAITRDAWAAQRARTGPA